MTLLLTGHDELMQRARFFGQQLPAGASDGMDTSALDALVEQQKDSHMICFDEEGTGLMPMEDIRSVGFAQLIAALNSNDPTLKYAELNGEHLSYWHRRYSSFRTTNARTVPSSGSMATQLATALTGNTSLRVLVMISMCSKLCSGRSISSHWNSLSLSFDLSPLYSVGMQVSEEAEAKALGRAISVNKHLRSLCLYST